MGTKEEEIRRIKDLIDSIKGQQGKPNIEDTTADIELIKKIFERILILID